MNLAFINLMRDDIYLYDYDSAKCKKMTEIGLVLKHIIIRKICTIYRVVCSVLRVVCTIYEVICTILSVLCFRQEGALITYLYLYQSERLDYFFQNQISFYQVFLHRRLVLILKSFLQKWFPFVQKNCCLLIQICHGEQYLYFFYAHTDPRNLHSISGYI